MVWEVSRDESNREYYFNTETGESQWEKPRELWSPQDHELFNAGWTEYMSDEGKPYWHNSKTNNSVWEYPLADQPKKRKGDHKNGPPAKTQKVGSMVLGNVDSPTTNNSDDKTFFDLVEADYNEHGDTEYAKVLPRLAGHSVVWAIESAADRQKQFNSAIGAITGKQTRLSPEEIAAIRTWALETLVSGDFGWPLSTDWDAFAKVAQESKGYQPQDLAMVSDDLVDRADKEWLEILKTSKAKMASKARQEFRALLKKQLANEKIKPTAQWSDKSIRELLDGPELRALCGNDSGSGPEALLLEVTGREPSKSIALEY